MLRIDLNADLGESDDPDRLNDDVALMTVISSASIACGAHAGGPAVMRRTVALAAARGVAVGAHPGFDDPRHFGRRELAITPADATELVRNQVLRLSAVAAAEGVRLAHVKPHGALYNLAARDRGIADAIAAAVVAVDPRLMLFGLAGSALGDAGRAAGLRTIAEAFADRGYLDDGSLAPRTLPGAVIDEPGVVASRAVRIACDGRVAAIGGSLLRVAADTLCIHGDTPGAAALARRVRAALEQAGVWITAPG